MAQVPVADRFPLFQMPVVFLLLQLLLIVRAAAVNPGKCGFVSLKRTRQILTLAKQLLCSESAKTVHEVAVFWNVAP